MPRSDERRYRDALRKIARMPDAIPQWDLARDIAYRVATEGLTFEQARDAFEAEAAEWDERGSRG